ncbi:MAG: hypothetical protein GY820_31980 [Gammaproteobacteria bacterium]|nr:hypothetical protein [Gammaproteobacteria bacterium]
MPPSGISDKPAAAAYPNVAAGLSVQRSRYFILYSCRRHTVSGPDA